MVGNIRLKNYLVEFKPREPVTADPWRLDRNTLFQIVDVRDISLSTVRYIDTLTELIDVNSSFADMQRTRTKSKRVVRSVNVDNEDGEDHLDDTADNDTSIAAGNRLFRLTLQDYHGNLCYGFEQEPLLFLRANNGLYPIPLGSKLIVKGGLTNVIFNCIQLTNLNTEYLGGEIDRMNFGLFERELGKMKKEIGRDD
ncbi:DEKNAAC103056 [Brettanomyces naardenensis]|uniref:DEKNAAC103056 n=1 Tax=Brettanomyces naardenensis TaxID=13370 RepID=A0A448YME2_BRENA|nr:DEKNAAC103056 [Brettanomyces naardenensis]